MTLEAANLHDVIAMQNPTVVFPAARKVVFEDRPAPTPERGEMLIRTRRTLISAGTELTILAEAFPSGSAWADYGSMPFVAGYSNVGEIAAIGEGVDESWIGSTVTSWGPHARLVIARADDPTVSRVTSATLEPSHLTLTTLAQTVMNGVRRSGVAWGDAVVIFGLGLLGQLAVRFCRLCGARPVIGVDLLDARLDLLRDDPAIHRVNPTRVDPPTAIRDATRGRGADVVFEVTGNPDLIPAQFDALRAEQGRFVVLSSPRGDGTKFNFHDLCNRPSHHIIGAHASSHPRIETPTMPWTLRRHAELFFDLIDAGELALASLISNERPYTEACETYLRLLNDRSQSMAVVLVWDA